MEPKLIDLEIDFRFLSRHPEDYFSWRHVQSSLEEQGLQLAEITLLARVRSFSTTMSSQILYAHSLYRGEGPKLLWQSISTPVSSARDVGIPVISCFFE